MNISDFIFLMPISILLIFAAFLLLQRKKNRLNGQKRDVYYDITKCPDGAEIEVNIGDVIKTFSEVERRNT